MSTSTNKTAGFGFRVSETVRDEFHAAARVLGTTAANLLHQYMVKVTREAKQSHPDEFAEKLVIVIAEKEAEEKKRQEKKQKKTEEAEIKASVIKARFDAGPSQKYADGPDGIIVEDDVDFEFDYDKRDANGRKIDARTGLPIIDLDLEPDYIPPAHIILIHPDEDEKK